MRISASADRRLPWSWPMRLQPTLPVTVACDSLTCVRGPTACTAAPSDFGEPLGNTAVLFVTRLQRAGLAQETAFTGALPQPASGCGGASTEPRQRVAALSPAVSL